MRSSIILFFVLINMNSSAALGDAAVLNQSSNCQKGMGTTAKSLTFLQDDLKLAYSSSIERRGCCSHHGGVCGCMGSMQECCDGTPSPSCRCGE